MTKLTGLEPEKVVNSIFDRLEELFEDLTIDNFETEISLTPLLEYGQTKEEFYCSGFIFQTGSKNTEIIFTAKRVITDDIGIDYGLRWCNCGPIDDSEDFELEDYISFRSTRKWILAKPYRENLLALGRNVPKGFRLSNEDGQVLYSPDVIEHLLVKILVDRIKRS